GHRLFDVLQRAAQAFAPAAAAAAGSDPFLLGLVAGQERGHPGVDIVAVGRRAELLDRIADAQQHRLADAVTNPFEKIDAHALHSLAQDAAVAIIHDRNLQGRHTAAAQGKSRRIIAAPRVSAWLPQRYKLTTYQAVC